MTAFLLPVLLGCVADVGKDRVAATVEDAPVRAAPAPAAGTELPVDRSRSTIRALGAKITAKHPIDFRDFTGSVTLDGDAPTAVKFQVEMATLESDNPKLTEHLKKEDFFFVQQHPRATFVSAGIAPGADGGTHEVVGELTIRGQTKRVTFPATFKVSPAEVVADAEFVLDRQDFGVTYPGKADDLVQDNVVLTVHLVAPRG